jgi:hypothetical protein
MPSARVWTSRRNAALTQLLIGEVTPGAHLRQTHHVLHPEIMIMTVLYALPAVPACRQTARQRTPATCLRNVQDNKAAVQHVPPRSFRKVWNFGLAHPRQGIERQWLRMLVAAALNSVCVPVVAAPPLPTAPAPACPNCGGDLTSVHVRACSQSRGACQRLRHEVNRPPPCQRLTVCRPWWGRGRTGF